MARPSQPPRGVPLPAPPLAAKAQSSDATNVHSSSVERVAAKESFAPDEPLPAFTFPAIDEETKQELLRRVEEAGAKAASSGEEAGARGTSSVERVAAKESFAPDEPLPAFTYPVIDEAQKQELLRRVEEASAASTRAAFPSAISAPGSTPNPLVPPRPEAVPSSPVGRGEPAKQVFEVKRMGRDVWSRASAAARKAIDAACTAIDQSRSRLPVRLRDALSRVPAGVILAALVGQVFVVLVGAFWLTRAVLADEPASGPEQSAVAPPPVPKEDPVPREVEEAKKGGHVALEKLATRYQNDPRVWLALAASFSKKGDHADAIGAVAKALAAAPEAKDEALASEVLAAAVRERPTTDEASKILTGPMGSSGATVIYDLSVDPKVPLQLRGRAEAWVKSEAFKKVAAADVELAAALRYAKSCSERHELLPRAAERGGQKVLDFLNVAKVPAGCGRRARGDCFPCLRKDSALKDAIAAIEKRLGAK